MTRIDNLLLAALAVLVTVAALVDRESVAGSHYTRDFRNGTAGISTIALLPPAARVTIVRAGGNGARSAGDAQIERAATAVTRQRLERAGYEVVAVTSEALAEDRQLRSLARLAEFRFEREFRKLRQDPLRLEQRGYTLDGAAVSLADHLDVDAVAFQKIDAVGAAGSQLMRAMTFGSPRGYVRVDLALVNGTNGDIEAWFSGRTRGVKAFRLSNYPEKVIAQAARLAYRRLPLASGEAEVADEQPVMAGAEASRDDGNGASLD